MTPTVVFVGPTLTSDQVRRLLPEAELAGPAARGDLFQATTAGATTLVLIDGLFDQKLPVLHKEVLWALSRGVQVYGGASMGALRAAELHPFGMVGIGRIYEWYVSGEIEADDEVAVAHESAERGYRAVSEAMVNLRASFLAAEGACVIRADTRARLVEVARTLFYPSRTLPEVLARAADVGVDATELSALRNWLRTLPEGIVDQKRKDALAVLERVRADLASHARSPRSEFSFEYTEVWHELTREVSAARQPRANLTPPVGVESTKTTPLDDWTERVMALLSAREPELAASFRREAAGRAALLDYAAGTTVEPDPLAAQAAANELRQRRNLLTREETEHWLKERGLDLAEFSQWMQEEERIARASELAVSSNLTQLRRVIHASEHSAVAKAIQEVNEHFDDLGTGTSED